MDTKSRTHFCSEAPRLRKISQRLLLYEMNVLNLVKDEMAKNDFSLLLFAIPFSWSENYSLKYQEKKKKKENKQKKDQFVTIVNNSGLGSWFDTN